MSDDQSDRTLPFGDAERLDALRSEFERASRSGSAPRIEDFLKLVEEALRPATFSELLKVEIALRRARQETVRPEDYLARFPAWESAIRDSCSKAANAAASTKQSGKSRSGVHTWCPHCDNPIEIQFDADLSDIRCATCGSHFSLSGDGDGGATFEARVVAQLAHFKLVKRLGKGEFGTVWKAHDTKLDRTVAIKISRSGEFDSQRRERFFREARSAAQLRHPNIVPIYEVGRDGDALYIVSELVRGVTLGEWLKGKRPPHRRSAELCAKIADALHHAHEEHIIHRDVKPENVMLDGAGEPHLMDFGLARRDVREAQLSGEGNVVGTPAYMSPEQAQGKSHLVDGRSDVFSLGVVLYEMLTGERPFRGSFEMLIYQLINEEPPNPRKLDPKVPLDLDTLAMKCLEKTPARRLPTAQFLSEELGRYLRGEPIHSRKIRLPGRLWRWCLRKPVVAGLSAAVAALMAVLAIAGPLIAIRQSQMRATAVKAVEDLTEERAKLFFALGVEKYDSGELQSGCEDLFRAWTILPEQHQLKSAYERVLVDRLTRGQRSWFVIGTEENESEDDDIAVTSALFSDDGQLVIASFEKGFTQSWDVMVGRPISKPMPCGPAYSPVGKLSPNGQLIVTYSANVARIRDVRTGEPTSQIMRHDGEITCAAFSPDGKYVATGALDQTARIWDAATGSLIAGQPMPHDSPVLFVAFNRDGSKLVTGFRSEEQEDDSLWPAGFWDVARIWNVSSGKPVGQHLNHRGAVEFIGFSPDNRLIATINSHSVQLWNGLDGQEQGELRPIDVGAAFFDVSADRNRIVAEVRAESDDSDGPQVSIRVLDVMSGSQIGPAVPFGGGDSLNVAFSGDGALLAAESDGLCRVWEVSSGDQVGEDIDLMYASSIAFSPDGRRLSTTIYDLGFQQWNVQTGRELDRLFQVKYGVEHPQYSPDGWQILCIDGGRARVCDARFHERLEVLNRGGQSYLDVCRLNRNGSRVLTVSSGAANLSDAVTGDELGSMSHEGERIWDAVFSPSEELIATCGGGTVRLWDTATFRETEGGPMAVPDDVALSVVAFSPDGRRLATGSSDGLRVWDAATKDRLEGPLDCDGAVKTLAYSPDGKRLITGSETGSACLWFVSGETLIKKPLHNTEGQSIDLVEFSPNSTIACTGSADYVVRLWDTTTGRQLGRPLRHGGAVQDAEFSPDGTRLATASDDNRARIWDAKTGKAIGDAMDPDFDNSRYTFFDFPTHSSVKMVGFNRSGDCIVTISDSRRVRLWDAATHQPLGYSMQLDHGVMESLFDPDAPHFLLFAGQWGEVNVWDCTPLPIPSEKRKWYELLLGKRLIDGDRFESLSDDEIAARWALLEQDQAWLDAMRDFHSRRARLAQPDSTTDQ